MNDGGTTSTDVINSSQTKTQASTGKRLLSTVDIKSHRYYPNGRSIGSQIALTDDSEAVTRDICADNTANERDRITRD